MISDNIKQVIDLSKYRDLVSEYFHKYNITDQTRIDSFIEKVSLKAEQNELFCFIYEDSEPKGLLVTSYAHGTKYILYEDYYFSENIPDRSRKQAEFIRLTSEYLRKEDSYLYRVYLVEDADPKLLNTLKDNGFDVYRREEMVYELNKEIETTSLPTGFNFVDYSKSRSQENRDVSKDSYIDDCDGRVYPEMFENKDDNYVVDNSEYSPHIEYKNKYVGISNTEKISESELLIHGLSIRKDFQSNGLGKAIMKEILIRATKDNLKKVYLTVSMDNLKAVSLYQKLGFKSFKVFYAINRVYCK
jgi:GNAT superfamily N-acetyltransferase